MTRRRTARELELSAAALPPPPSTEACPEHPALAALVRRGFRPEVARPDLPFDPDLDETRAAQLAEHLGHYAFRLFLRGAIQHPEGFAPQQATRYVGADAAAGQLVALGLAAPIGAGRYRLLRPARSFGGTLEWYLARELRRRLGYAVATGVKFGGPAVGGDLDVVAVADGRLVYLELKSGPPKHLSASEVSAFFDRLKLLRPDVAVFVLDSSLRLSDKVAPMLEAELRRRAPGAAPPRRLLRQLWLVAPQLYAVNAQPDLVANVGRVIAHGLLSRAPCFP